MLFTFAHRKIFVKRMKTTKKVLLLSFVILSVINMHGQNDFGHVSPQTADFVQYSETPVSLFTGRMNFEVPIYRIKDRDFDIPISLIYTADGFKPQKRSDFVGLDWILNAGGCITREVYGSPDESNPRSAPASEHLIGNEMGYLLTLQKTNFNYTKTKVWNFDPSIVYVNDVTDNSYYYLQMVESRFVDYQPDLFMFNFNGHTGRFMINSDGSAIANDKGYQVNIFGLTEQFPFETILPETSSIQITTPDGYVYEFGGSLENLEFAISFTNGSGWQIGSTRPVILAWHLSKITAPNGRTVKFNYATDPIPEIPTTSPIWQSDKAEKVSNTINTYVGRATKKAILESIEVDSEFFGLGLETNNVKIEFKKSIETTLGPSGNYNDRFFTEHFDFNRPIYQLDSISVKYGNTPIYNYTLTYANQNKRRFLSSVIQPDSSQYEFTYNHTTYPSPSENVTDAYGYWRKTISPNATNSYGLLSRIKYPTGGYSTFTYEPHQYKNAAELDFFDLTKHLVTSSNQDEIVTTSSGGGPVQFENGFEGGFAIEGNGENQLPPTNTTTIQLVYNLGGARIKKVSHYSANNTKETEKEYFYRDSINGVCSSGILSQSRPYYTTLNGAKVYILESTWNKNYNIDECPIGYSSVFEKNLDGSYYRYKFSNFLWNPDEAETKTKKCQGATLNTSDLVFCSINRVTSGADKRGLLIEKYSYNANGTVALYERSDYEGVVSGIFVLTNAGEPEFAIEDLQPGTDDIVSFKSMSGGGLAKIIHLRSHPMTYKQEKRANVTKEEYYSYNNYNLLQTKSIILQPADTLKVNYKYPFDYAISPYTGMVSHNILTPIIEQSEYKNNQLLFTTKIEYKLWGNTHLYAPEFIKKQLNQSTLETRITYHNYDFYGNPMYSSKDNAEKVVYIWSGNGQYLLAEIKNATYSEVHNTLPSSILMDENAAVNSLRTQLPNAQVTTYTYKPLVGILTSTDPRGVITTYDYDAYGRLQAIKDENNTVIDSYYYHYKN
jgi:YD repeat-containing protein